AGGTAGGEGGEALLRAAVVPPEVALDHRLDGTSILGVEIAEGGELVGQRPGLDSGPGLGGGDELGLVDQAVLQRGRAEEELALGVGGHGWPSQPRRDGGPSRAPPPSEARPSREADRSDYRIRRRPTPHHSSGPSSRPKFALPRRVRGRSYKGL